MVILTTPCTDTDTTGKKSRVLRRRAPKGRRGEWRRQQRWEQHRSAARTEAQRRESRYYVRIGTPETRVSCFCAKMCVFVHKKQQHIVSWALLNLFDAIYKKQLPMLIGF